MYYAYPSIDKYGVSINDQIGINFESEKLTHEEETILATLRHGRGNALSMKFVAESAGLNSRSLQAIIHHLIVHHGKAIGSTSKAPAGYYLIETEAELAEATKHLESRALSVLHRMASLKKVGFAELLKQMSLKEEK